MRDMHDMRVPGACQARAGVCQAHVRDTDCGVGYKNAFSFLLVLPYATSNSRLPTPYPQTSKMPCIQGNAWCLTINNPPAGEESNLPVHPQEKYVVWQLERGASGTPHIQCYLETTRRVSITTVTAFLVSNNWPHPHVEKRMGTAIQAKHYCEKESTREPEGGPWSRGEFVAGQQGKRNDLADMIQTMKAAGGGCSSN